MGVSIVSFSDLIVGLIPGLAWLYFIHRKDDCEPEPWHLVFAAFLMGGGAALATNAFRPGIEFAVLTRVDQQFHHIADAVLITSLPEELFKCLALLIGAFWSKEWNEPLDGIVYASAVALGFASVENSFYLALEDDVRILVMRAFTSTLAHLAFSAALGFLISLATHRSPWIRIGLAILGFLTAWFVHALYDLALSYSRIAPYALAIGLPLLLLVLALQIRWARARSAELFGRSCPIR